MKLEKILENVFGPLKIRELISNQFSKYFKNLYIEKLQFTDALIHMIKRDLKIMILNVDHNNPDINVVINRVPEHYGIFGKVFYRPSTMKSIEYIIYDFEIK